MTRGGGWRLLAPALVLLTVRYEHARDGSAGVLVYPFYLEG